MNKRTLWNSLLFLPAVLLLALPATSATVTITSSITPPNPQQGVGTQPIQYAPAATSATTGTVFTLGNFGPASTGTVSPTFTLLLNDVSFVVTFGANSTLTLSGSGTETVGTTIFVTQSDANYTFGVQQSPSGDVGKGIALNAIITTAIPEPAPYLITGLGFLTLGMLGWKRRATGLVR